MTLEFLMQPSPVLHSYLTTHLCSKSFPP